MTLRRRPTSEEVTSAYSNAQATAEEERHAQVRELLPRVDWEDLWEKEDDIEWLIQPIMPARALVAVYSAAGIGKSLLMLEIGAGLSCGRQVLGHNPERRYRVLYIDFENDLINDVRDRLQNMEYKPADLDYLDFLSYPNLAHLDSPQGARELLAAVEAYGSEIVVIDTISRAVGGEENDNDTWLNFYKYTGLALKQKGVAMIRLDHTGKDVAKGERGGSAKAGDVDAAWKLTELKKGEQFKLSNTKSRFRLEQREITILRHDKPLRHTLEDTSKRNERELRIEELLRQLESCPHPKKKTGKPKLMEWLKEQGIPYGSEDLAEATRRRKKPDLAFKSSKQSQTDLETDPAARSGAESERKNLTYEDLGQVGQAPATGPDLANNPIGVGVGQLAGEVNGQTNGHKPELTLDDLKEQNLCDLCLEPLAEPSEVLECADQHAGGR